MRQTRRRSLFRIRAVQLLQTSLLVLVFGVALMAAGMFAAIEYTAQPDFCRTCHNMEPFYQSWKKSSHSKVPCIECHYEPGAVETLDGKFKALSQLAKYATRTQGTKPWAEVSDDSCMRSGCHYTRLLEGPIRFGKVKYDHGPHLLENTKGHRLQCTTCHSQVLQIEHFSVSKNLCFTCHFMDESKSGFRNASDCLKCHVPPKEAIPVDGKPFLHSDYTNRGVQCRECHDPASKGAGQVRRERCPSCHGEVEYLERYEETVFLHQSHVTDHKVECFECHDDIQHGLLPLESPVKSSEGCGSCHVTPHDANQMLYAGTGAVGVEDRPSRMFQTRIVCQACHTGRSQPKAGMKKKHGTEGSSHIPTSVVAAAGEVDCFHCHDVKFEGMLPRWQGSVEGVLAELLPALEALGQKLPDSEDHPARQLYLEAKQNVDLVVLDGSKGAHNVSYALDALRVSAERIAEASKLLDPEAPAVPVGKFPLSFKSDCASGCHLGVEETKKVEFRNGEVFPHRRHLVEGKLDCASCHSTEEHGQPAFPRSQCGNCHHQPAEGSGQEIQCATCHATQAGMIAGELQDLKGEPSIMAESVSCDGCHGEAPEIVRPTGETCIDCHEDGYEEFLAEWRSNTAELQERLRKKLFEAEDDALPADLIQRAKQVLQWTEQDGSKGVHNADFVEEMLTEALRKLK